MSRCWGGLYRCGQGRFRPRHDRSPTPPTRAWLTETTYRRATINLAVTQISISAADQLFNKGELMTPSLYFPKPPLSNVVEFFWFAGYDDPPPHALERILPTGT